MVDTPKKRLPGRVIDITGQKFGNFVVLHQLPGHQYNTKSKSSWWMVRCKCGKEMPMRADFLKKGKRRTCGCDQTRKETRGAHSPHWRGHGEISGTAWNAVVAGASQRSLPMKITIEEAWSLFLAQERRCALSGVELTFGTGNLARCPRTASLDRKDSSLGYVRGNCQWVHKDVNVMKMAMPENEFFLWCHTIASYQINRLASASKNLRTPGAACSTHLDSQLSEVVPA